MQSKHTGFIQSTTCSDDQKVLTGYSTTSYDITQRPPVCEYLSKSPGIEVSSDAGSFDEKMAVMLTNVSIVGGRRGGDPRKVNGISKFGCGRMVEPFLLLLCFILHHHVYPDEKPKKDTVNLCTPCCSSTVSGHGCLNKSFVFLEVVCYTISDGRKTIRK